MKLLMQRDLLLHYFITCYFIVCNVCSFNSDTLPYILLYTYVCHDYTRRGDSYIPVGWGWTQTPTNFD